MNPTADGVNVVRAGAQTVVVQRTVAAGEPRIAVDYLAAFSGLPKGRLKDAMNKGAVVVRHGRAPAKRLRRATAALQPGDRIELHYDPQILALRPALPLLIAERAGYSVWFKPAGLLAQGNEFGDHCSLLRQVELQTRRLVHLIHRLDREAMGLMVVAHTPHMAAALSRLFEGGTVEKLYRVQVRGALAAAAGRIDEPLDGRPARTDYTVESHDVAHATSTVRVQLHSGRLHQIRRHFAFIGHPVLGDPRYGHGNQDARGLRLAAVALAFTDPASGRVERFEAPAVQVGF